ncbi:50S ribosomal protein L24 [Clostridiales bacterium F-3ap]|uniref:Large ribosomal subunit protein uL24 n=1 Tax=Anaerotalea alkaliphila TaxID=2662126 RepID=A0A7X5HWX6_9FIRM|nr:50S ribosomal protein L24 [Anaerotalea alkaliphila]
MKLKVGDNVRVIAGKDKNKEGKIHSIDRKKGRVVVEGVNMITKHTKPSPSNQQGGIVHQEAAIDASNVMYLHKGKPTRLGIKVTTEERNGVQKTVRQRVAKSTGELID